ncbi:MAG: FHA domain-containing protein [Chloroflexi bacterium]|nr:MAG: FHA domain-containing protein [Chloroflexota bacterium]MBL1193783.1 FHA domain-containing protein [Chloroflexota bacterium]NOH11076.1 FHA domain-containing protein [Chloroflexota bacterium]
MTSIQDFKLVQEAGPSSGEELVLDKPEVVIGRDESADWTIAFTAVSRNHAKVYESDGGYKIEDMGSSNGTFVNGEKISSPTELKPGDTIKLGQAVEISFHAPQTETADEAVEEDSLDSTRLEMPAVEEAPVAEADATVERKIEVPNEQAQTVIGEVLPEMVAAPDTPAELSVTVAGATPESYSLTKNSITIGRSDDNDVVINSPIVSRHHARLDLADGGYQITALPEASNPVYVGGSEVKGAAARLRHNDKLRIGGQDPGRLVSMTYVSPSEAPVGEAIEITFDEDNLVAIGRDSSNEVTLATPQVSRYHAQIEKVGQRFRLKDLNSSNGTFVNDQRVEGEVWLTQDDVVRIGPYRFDMGVESLAQYDESGEIHVDVYGLNKWVRSDLNILQDISLAINPREFVVVVGQSGGGKSTLVDSIAGYRPATHGQVLVNGINVYENFDAIRNIIGFVPQKDIIHMELTVFDALDYTAQLRMPPDTTKEERHQRVMEVMEELDISHRKDNKISALSGGQQKRVSIGVELLTKPSLFFLDEPSSGLDPGTETSLMHLMRRLADQGRTILLITHATKNVVLADKVVFLARGGHLVWYGPPDEALTYFNQYRSEREQRTSDMEFDQIYAILDDSSKGSPEEWGERYKQHPAYQENVVQPLTVRSQQSSGTPSVGDTAQPVDKSAQQSVLGAGRKQVSAFKQFLILSQRNIKILVQDRFSLALMLAAAPIVSLLDVVLALLLGNNPFDFWEGVMTSVVITTFLITIYGVLVGGLAQMREIVKEGDIYKRERLVNLKILPYVLSKVWVAALLALYQAGAYTIVRHLAFDMPGGITEFLLFYITLTIGTFAGMMIGLFSSAVAPNANSAPLIVILLMLPQIVIGGALVPMPRFVSAITTTSWTFEGLMSISGSGSDLVGDTCWQELSYEDHANMTLDQKNANCDCLGLNSVRQDRCDFPGIGVFYQPIVDEPFPPPPGDPPVKPDDPNIPDPPPEPVDQSDTVAVAEYLQALQVYQDEVQQLQVDAGSDFAVYEQEITLYQARAVEYNQALGISQGIMAGAEGTLRAFHRDLGWSFVDKTDTGAYFLKLVSTWMAQGVYITILFVAILILQKRKDTT